MLTLHSVVYHSHTTVVLQLCYVNFIFTSIVSFSYSNFPLPSSITLASSYRIALYRQEVIFQYCNNLSYNIYTYMYVSTVKLQSKINGLTNGKPFVSIAFHLVFHWDTIAWQGFWPPMLLPLIISKGLILFACKTNRIVVWLLWSIQTIKHFLVSQYFKYEYSNTIE